jgi:hypothetical protein
MKTAIEWLVEVVQSCISPDYIPQEIVKQAKEMEKEQIMNAMDWIMNKYFEFHEQPTTGACEQYYNETFKSE